MSEFANLMGSRSYMDRARNVIPRGVTSHKRATLRPSPLLMVDADGSRMTDVDGNEYIDYVSAYGPMFLGHQHPRVIAAVREQLDRGVLFGAQHEGEAQLADQIIELVPSAQRVLFNVSGSEAVQSAVRLARAASGRPKVVKFEGHYHGWIDPFTANQVGTPASRASTESPIIAADFNVVGPELLVCPWNDVDALKDTLSRHPGQVAAVIMEPLAINGGNIWAHDGYLQAVRDLCDTHGVLLIFDEVITGFRVAAGGAQQLLKVTPDLTVLAKVLGSGFPISAVVGRHDVMAVADARVGHSGTYNGNAISMAAASATLSEIVEHGTGIYPRVESLTERLAAGIRQRVDAHCLPIQVLSAPSVVRLHWGAPRPVTSYADVLDGNAEPVAVLSEALVLNGIHLRENGLWFLSAAHSAADIAATMAAFDSALESVLPRLLSASDARR